MSSLEPGSSPALHSEDLIVTDVRAIDPEQGLDAVVDVVVTRGHISALGAGAARQLPAGQARPTLAGAGRWLLPGFVELYAHAQEPGVPSARALEVTLRAAAAGGYAHVALAPEGEPIHDAPHVTELLLARAARVVGPQLHPIAALSRQLAGAELTELGSLRDAGAVAVSEGMLGVQSSALLGRGLDYARMVGLPLLQRCHDAELAGPGLVHEGPTAARLGLRGISRAAEESRLARDLVLAQEREAPFHALLLSSAGSVELVRQAQRRGGQLSASVAPQHLLYTDEQLEGFDARFKVLPPLREAADRDALLEGLVDGTLSAVCSAHLPLGSAQREGLFTEVPPGMLGLELSLSLLLGLVAQRKLSAQRLSQVLSAGPARILGLPAPRLAVGARAEFCLVDPALQWAPSSGALVSHGTNHPAFGGELTGRVVATMAGGRLVHTLPPHA